MGFDSLIGDGISFFVLDEERESEERERDQEWMNACLFLNLD